MNATPTITVPPVPDASPSNLQPSARDSDPVAGIERLGEAAGDIMRIPERIRPRALMFFAFFRDGARWRDALDKAELRACDIVLARRRSSTFANAFDFVRSAREFSRVARIEDALFDAAQGDDFHPPDAKAAQLLLAAWDRKRFGHEPAQTTPQVILNVQL